MEGQYPRKCSVRHIGRFVGDLNSGSKRSGCSATSNNDPDDDRLPYLPGYFRMLTLMAVFIFAHYESDNGNRIEAVILEVGVGGRYDATNIFDHSNTNSVCGVTLIDYDHTRVLGSSLLQIAWEKGGIFHTDKGQLSTYFQKTLTTLSTALQVVHRRALDLLIAWKCQTMSHRRLMKLQGSLRSIQTNRKLLTFYVHAQRMRAMARHWA